MHSFKSWLCITINKGKLFMEGCSMPKPFKNLTHARKLIIHNLIITFKPDLVKSVFFLSLNSHFFDEFLRVTSCLSLRIYL